MDKPASINRSPIVDTPKPAPVSPVYFAEAMREHWEGLGMVSSEKLTEQWRAMGAAFSRAILVGSGSMKGRPGEEHQWQILQLPTGTGKTQGAGVYAAMVAQMNRNLPDGNSSTGILFVTRMISEADGLARSINQVAGFNCAVTRHSNNKIDHAEMSAHDVLVITHQSYANALERQSLGEPGFSISDFLTWDGGRRFLTVIDESMEQLVKEYQVTDEELRVTHAAFDQELRDEFPWIAKDIDTLSGVMQRMENLVEAFEGKNPKPGRWRNVLWVGGRADKEWLVNKARLSELRKRMRRLKYDQIFAKGEDPIYRKYMADRIDAVLKAYENMGEGFAYRETLGKKKTFNTAKLLIPDELPGPVVLDATAKQETLWELLGKRANIHGAVEGVRNYKNVRLHVARTLSVGKTSMMEFDEQRLTRLFDHLGHTLSQSKVFLCLHKKLEPLAKTYTPNFQEYSVDHWGNIDGRNAWRDFDTAILFGLPFRPKTWAKNKIYAVLGVDTSMDALSISGFQREKHFDQIEARQLATSVIQAINRIRCRKVIDEDGNCPQANVYLVLPKGWRGDAILDRIVDEMSGAQVLDWDFKVDGERKRISRAAYAEPVVDFMKGRPPGQTSIKAICEALALSRNAKKDLQADLRDSQNSLYMELKELGVTYHSEGKGRGSRSYLFKR